MSNSNSGRQQSARTSNSRGAAFNLAGFVASEERRVSRLTRAAWNTLREHPSAGAWTLTECKARVAEWVAEALEAREERLTARAQGSAH